ncbi:MAG: DUF134 domain-containing protein, partial [Spirochaetota bacterium]
AEKRSVFLTYNTSKEIISVRTFPFPGNLLDSYEHMPITAGMRPKRCRNICGTPDPKYFKPRGIPLTELEELTLSIDEYEAVRLADLEQMYQDEAARMMGVSRQTFGRIILSAHRKIADAVVNGKAIRIEGADA